jgi:DNA-binding Lrp family transcriptional regulator
LAFIMPPCIYFLPKKLVRIILRKWPTGRSRGCHKEVGMKNWTAQVNIKWDQDAPLMTNWDWLRNWKEVKWVAELIGDWDLQLGVDVNGPDELEEFIEEKLMTQEWIIATHSIWTKEIWAA